MEDVSYVGASTAYRVRIAPDLSMLVRRPNTGTDGQGEAGCLRGERSRRAGLAGERVPHHPARRDHTPLPSARAPVGEPVAAVGDPHAPERLLLVPFFFAPLAIMLVYSFHRFIPGGRQEPAFILDNYWRFVSDGFYRGILVDTLLMGAAVTGLALVLSYPLAYTLARSRSRWKGSSPSSC